MIHVLSGCACVCVCVGGGGGGACACVFVRAHVLTCLGLWRGARNNLFYIEFLAVSLTLRGKPRELQEGRQVGDQPCYDAGLRGVLEEVLGNDEQIREVTEKPQEQTADQGKGQGKQTGKGKGNARMGGKGRW